jgi:hypothetical protein
MKCFLYIKETQEIVSKHCSMKAAERKAYGMPMDGNKYEIIPLSELPVSTVYILAYHIDPLETEELYAVYYHYQQAYEAASKNVKTPRYLRMTPRIYFKTIY